MQNKRAKLVYYDMHRLQVLVEVYINVMEHVFAILIVPAACTHHMHNHLK